METVHVALELEYVVMLVMVLRQIDHFIYYLLSCNFSFKEFKEAESKKIQNFEGKKSALS